MPSAFRRWSTSRETRVPSWQQRKLAKKQKKKRSGLKKVFFFLRLVDHLEQIFLKKGRFLFFIWLWVKKMPPQRGPGRWMGLFFLLPNRVFWVPGISDPKPYGSGSKPRYPGEHPMLAFKKDYQTGGYPKRYLRF